MTIGAEDVATIPARPLFNLICALTVAMSAKYKPTSAWTAAAKRLIPGLAAFKRG